MDRKYVYISILIIAFALSTAGCLGGYDKSVSAEEGLAMLTDQEIDPEIQNHVDMEKVGLDVSDGNLLITIETYGDIPNTIEEGATVYEVNVKDLGSDEASVNSLALEFIGDTEYFNAEKPVEGDLMDIDGAGYTVDSKFFGGYELIFEVPLEEIDDPDEVGIQVHSEWSDPDGFGTAMDFIPLDEDGNVDSSEYIKYEV
ncbi:hypothetical protein [Methanonatronarchaeum sp. AMET-Sl]|uniref:hypothetical protein n=1 Tax=Methanonatronarchaeum sp. AMET-Sl TaxID=3037654 RepID=UPI00244E1187|nr:hypothetical protein [Methanonatronarchaeum sp. AMET-Sl]WGI17521.1 hypothetical protein QEN48_00505 [Methanonatronarchaeum sp. AMET-Sl]